MSNEIISGTMVVPSPFPPGSGENGLVSQLSNGEWFVSGSVPIGIFVQNLPEGGTSGPLYGIDLRLYGSPVTYTLDGHVYDAGMEMLSTGYVMASTPGVHT